MFVLLTFIRYYGRHYGRFFWGTNPSIITRHVWARSTFTEFVWPYQQSRTTRNSEALVARATASNECHGPRTSLVWSMLSVSNMNNLKHTAVYMAKRARRRRYCCLSAKSSPSPRCAFIDVASSLFRRQSIRHKQLAMISMPLSGGTPSRKWRQLSNCAKLRDHFHVMVCSAHQEG